MSSPFAVEALADKRDASFAKALHPERQITVNEWGRRFAKAFSLTPLELRTLSVISAMGPISHGFASETLGRPIPHRLDKAVGRLLKFGLIRIDALGMVSTTEVEG